MISKNDIVLMLINIQDSGIDVGTRINDVLTSSSVSTDVLKFINSSRPLDIIAFYERLRYNYNNHRSPLYKNIVKDTEDVNEVLSTLSAYALQVQLYSKHVEEVEEFFKHSKVKDVCRVLSNYYTNYNIEDAIKMLKVIKTDLKLFESVK